MLRAQASLDLCIRDPCVLEAALQKMKELVANGTSLSLEECVKMLQSADTTSKLVQKHFPGAIGSSIVLEKVKTLMEEKQWTPEDVLYAQSVCPDEINHEEGDITDLLSKHMGEVFHLGGLGGIPFSGKTGFAAFSHHVPANGHCFILLAPHIGLSEEGHLGKYSRFGQKSAGSACGAAVGAYGCVCQGKTIADDDDQQFGFICREIERCKASIDEKEGENAKQTELVKQMHTIAKSMLDKIVSTEFGDENSKLIVLTGIQINMPQPFEDYFQPLSFTVSHGDGNVEDLLSDTFGL